MKPLLFVIIALTLLGSSVRAKGGGGGRPTSGGSSSGGSSRPSSSSTSGRPSTSSTITRPTSSFSPPSSVSRPSVVHNYGPDHIVGGPGSQGGPTLTSGPCSYYNCTNNSSDDGPGNYLGDSNDSSHASYSTYETSSSDDVQRYNQSALRVVGLAVGLPLVVLGIVLCCLRKKIPSRIDACIHKLRWKLACEVAKRKVLRDAAKTPTDTTSKEEGPPPLINFVSASFTASYNDTSYHHQQGQSQLASNGTLRFENIMGEPGEAASSSSVNIMTNARLISGAGTDKDGTLLITMGRICIYSGKAYWIEDSPGAGTKTLVTGTFFRESAEKGIQFAGSFVCDNGASGGFSRFDLNPKEEEEPDIEVGYN